MTEWDPESRDKEGIPYPVFPDLTMLNANGNKSYKDLIMKKIQMIYVPIIVPSERALQYILLCFPVPVNCFHKTISLSLTFLDDESRCSVLVNK
jgi:hypothetical protein